MTASTKIRRTWIINGAAREVCFQPLARLLDVLREELDLISLKEGCSEGECGACSVILDGELHLACLVAAAQVEGGMNLLTAEGLGQEALGRALQESYERHGAIQCGYCSPGMLLGSYALLKEHPNSSIEQIREGLAGHLCRCTGYSSIIDAVRAVAKEQEA